MGLKTLQAAQAAAIYALSNPPANLPAEKKQKLAKVVEGLRPNQEQIAEAIIVINST